MVLTQEVDATEPTAAVVVPAWQLVQADWPVLAW